MNRNDAIGIFAIIAALISFMAWFVPYTNKHFVAPPDFDKWPNVAHSIPDNDPFVQELNKCALGEYVAYVNKQFRCLPPTNDEVIRHDLDIRLSESPDKSQITASFLGDGKSWTTSAPAPKDVELVRFDPDGKVWVNPRLGNDEPTRRALELLRIQLELCRAVPRSRATHEYPVNLAGASKSLSSPPTFVTGGPISATAFTMAGKEVLRINTDGTITSDPSVKPDAAAAQVLKTIKDLYPGLCRSAPTP